MLYKINHKVITAIYLVYALSGLVLYKHSNHSDVWSYGMLLYELWSLGESSFKDLQLQEVAECVWEIVICSPVPMDKSKSVMKYKHLGQE